MEFTRTSPCGSSHYHLNSKGEINCVQGYVAKPALEKVGPPDPQACARNVASHFSLCIRPGPGMLIVRVGNSFWTQAGATGHHCGDIASRGFKLQDSDSSQRQATGPLSEGLGPLM